MSDDIRKKDQSEDQDTFATEQRGGQGGGQGGRGGQGGQGGRPGQPDDNPRQGSPNRDRDDDNQQGGGQGGRGGMGGGQKGGNR